MTTWQAINWTGHAATTVVVDDANTLSGKHIIAECDTEETADLVAVAPQMLACLNACVSELQAWMRDIGPDVSTMYKIEAAQAVIAKAMGN